MRRIRVRIESAEQRIWLYQHFPDPDVSGIMTQRGWDSNLAKYTGCEMILVRGWAYMENTEENKAILAEAALRTGIIMDDE